MTTMENKEEVVDVAEGNLLMEHLVTELNETQAMLQQIMKERKGGTRKRKRMFRKKRCRRTRSRVHR